MIDIIVIYELLTSIAPIIIYCFLCKKEMSNLHRVGLIVFGIYLFGILHFTGSGTFYELKRFGIELRADQLNFSLFSEGFNIVHDNLNILLFVPLGFLMSFIWLRFNKVQYALFFGFSVSLIIEISQLFNHRSTDVNDLLLNTLGAVIGFIIYKIYICSTQRFNFMKQFNIKIANDSIYEIYVLILSAFLSRFFLFNEFGIASLIYGF